MKNKKVFVSGFFDLLNSGHVSFLKEAAGYGDLYVGVGSDTTFEELKGRKPVASEEERLYMVKAVRHVKDAFINAGSGILDFLDELDHVKPDIFIVNSDSGNDLKRKACEERGILFKSIGASAFNPLRPLPLCDLCVNDTAQGNNTAHSADTEPTAPILRTQCANTAKQGFAHTPSIACLPYRIDIAGTWIDQPYVSRYGGGWAITASIEPTHEFMERGGMSTSTRNAAKKIWPYELPAYNEEMLARLLFCFENDPENTGHVSGAQDAIGICISGLSRHYYDGHYWPERIETVHDEDILSWIESHVCLVPMFPRRPGCSVVDGKDITPEKVKDLADAAARCWDAIMARDLDAFAAAFRDSFNAQVAMFPAMMQPGVQEHIDRWKGKALAWKMLGAGGGGHLLLVVDQIPASDGQVIPVKIRRF
ncbi:MAG: adenylyltransferase/cytidyltransferase family protein [Muribaculaceae bacterium]|nr:adenylyltransferase/cytidyltransferase family protein [Muribaculaceae bacterium]